MTDNPNDVNSIPDTTLLKRAIQNCRARQCNKGVKHARWVAVMDTFGLGAGFSQQLCRRFGINPDEQVKR